MELRKISQEELEEVLEQHWMWLTSAGIKGHRADLSYTNLSGRDLHGANLQNGNLKGANLRDADLWDSHLENAKMDNTTKGINDQCPKTGSFIGYKKVISMDCEPFL